MPAWKQIGCAVDFSAHSWAALERAADLARRLGAQLILVHVIPPGEQGVRAHAERALGMAEERILGRLEEWRAAAARIAACTGRTSPRTKYMPTPPIAGSSRLEKIQAGCV